MQLRRKPLANPFIGAMKHSALWLKSKPTHLTFPNPNFNPAYQKGYTIFCVHGTADGNASFTNFIANIIERLPDFVARIKCVSFENRAQGESNDGFSRQLRAVIRKKGDSDVILVGHSRGGLIASHFAENHGLELDINIHMIATLCTPFNGAISIYKPAALISTSVKQMMPGSDFLRDLNEKVANSHIKYIHVGAARDKIIATDSHRPTDESEHVLFLEDEGHLSAVSALETSEFFIEHLNQLPRPVHLLNNPEPVPILDDVQKAIRRLMFHADKMPDDAPKLKCRDREGHLKQMFIASLLKSLEQTQSLAEKQALVNQALESHYEKARQTNALLVSRGSFHLYWVKSLFTKKVNPVSHRYSRSTTEDLLIDLKHVLDAAPGEMQAVSYQK